ncbi:hypothetical protein [Pseudomonas avellanae]|uniref:Uncharacterized protein n=1 Tax=Pseudomonas avellanae TaxID=46257 RepID=A0A3M5U631_9PSED|nr:hypothetical protein [Pseudomonas avellanae]RMU40657.1 hypothetical protein ALP32_02185 [Pseudomonas avellanae]UQW66734.1 hypothetical protein L2Y00_15380 [Pseudomonas avellanae]UQW75221.1 hypothetical protein L2Y01_05085 [Pseudomonas avellanae]GGJ28852.1 hypothetical protein GCM10009085_23790 [Pseudomonas avellanae]
MSIITKWMLQAIALFMLGWMATVTASWSNNVSSGTGNDRLGVLSSPAVTVATSRNLQSE